MGNELRVYFDYVYVLNKALIGEISINCILPDKAKVFDVILLR